MKIDADWLTSNATQSAFAILRDAGHLVFAVGGCVRNALLNEPVRDIDLSTDAHPETVMQLAEAAGLRAVPTGIEHGTVTVVVHDEQYEITTFRRDVETDGRRAVVAFSDRMEDDALRRDFTMNALYADAAGLVHDPVGGLADLQARRIRFIEDADRRIQEDYLRTLRYFRFNAWYGDSASGYDPDALDAIARNLDGLERLSRERVGSEMKRLLEAPDPTAAVAIMRTTGVLTRILPGADDTALGPLIALENGMQPNPIRRLAVLGGESVSDHLRLSRQEASELERLRGAIGQEPATLGYRLGATHGLDAYLLTAALTGTGPVSPSAVAEIKAGAQQVFSVTAADLMPSLQGPKLGAALKTLEQDWI
ncbi:MAG: CCA tRNA nucleotidyltransferase, partial [Pseudomonadota bacterium]